MIGDIFMLRIRRSFLSCAAYSIDLKESTGLFSKSSSMIEETSLRGWRSITWLFLHNNLLSLLIF